MFPILYFIYYKNISFYSTFAFWLFE